MIARLNVVVEDAEKREWPKRVVNKGYFIGVCVNNENAAAGNYPSAQELSACVVGATAQYDRRYIWSNTGLAVDLMAPGCDIPSLWPGGGTVSQNTTSNY